MKSAFLLCLLAGSSVFAQDISSGVSPLESSPLSATLSVGMIDQPVMLVSAANFGPGQPSRPAAPDQPSSPGSPLFGQAPQAPSLPFQPLLPTDPGLPAGAPVQTLASSETNSGGVLVAQGAMPVAALRAVESVQNMSNRLNNLFKPSAVSGAR